MRLHPACAVTISVEDSLPVRVYQPVEGGWRFTHNLPYGMDDNGWERLTFDTLDDVAARIGQVDGHGVTE